MKEVTEEECGVLTAQRPVLPFCCVQAPSRQPEMFVELNGKFRFTNKDVFSACRLFCTACQCYGVIKAA